MAGLALALALGGEALVHRTREWGRLSNRRSGLTLACEAGRSELAALNGKMERFRNDTAFVVQLARDAGLVRRGETVFVHVPAEDTP